MIKKLIAIVVLVGTGVVIGTYLQQEKQVTEPIEETVEVTTVEMAPVTEEESPDVGTETLEERSLETELQAEATVIDPDLINADQKELLESFGIDTTGITVTAEMIACAEEKVGKERVEEIKNGATPGFLEGLSLVSCY